MGAKAVAFHEASQPSFVTYAQKIVDNSAALSAACMEQGMTVLTGGTDNHLLLVDVSKSYGLTGRQAESALRECGITLNRNSLPFDANGPWYTSGLRLGTPATTTRGMGKPEMTEIANIIHAVLSKTKPSTSASGEVSKAKYDIAPGAIDAAKGRVSDLLGGFPLYPELGAL
jgi:glycine hydroxymethyltransferase